MAGNRTVTISCERLRETDEAIQVEIDGVDCWFPLSTVEEMHFDGREIGTIVVEEWIAKKKGLA